MLLLDDPRIAAELTPHGLPKWMRSVGYKSIDEVLEAFRHTHTPWELSVTRYLIESERDPYLRFGW
jgi:hypothetical protein